MSVCGRYAVLAQDINVLASSDYEGTVCVPPVY
ncbi:unnamed protein product [Leptidea sinapis]|uniref:Uncharacterized protein n=1 Tax=Leptidea sinapis TaxID=189913 RepID=A0A5E4QJG0_9NEOP|nr:unnamed protein product [Leptidea sinapis]